VFEKKISKNSPKKIHQKIRCLKKKSQKIPQKKFTKKFGVGVNNGDQNFKGI